MTFRHSHSCTWRSDEICPGVTMYPGKILVPRKYPGTPEVSLLKLVLSTFPSGGTTPEVQQRTSLALRSVESRRLRSHLWRPPTPDKSQNLRVDGLIYTPGGFARGERSEAPPSEARLHRNTGGSAERSEGHREVRGRHYKKTQKGSTRKPRGTTY